MSTIRIPTPLRPYVGGQTSVVVDGTTIGTALAHLTTQYPELRQHLFEGDTLRSFVNVYVNQEDIRNLQGAETPLTEGDKVMIVPSIAGGAGGAKAVPAQVDHAALRTNQAFIMVLLGLAFVLDSWQVVAFVAAVMLLGTAVPPLGLFKLVYQHLLKPLGWVKPDVQADDPAPHRFAQGFGGVVVAAATAALAGGAAVLGWALVWLVITLAGLNFFLGFCAGCFVYYQLKLGARE